MVKKVRGSHRSDLATVRNCAIARSAAIDRASYEHVRKLTDTVVNRSKLFVNSRITGKWQLSVMQVNGNYCECRYCWFLVKCKTRCKNYVAFNGGMPPMRLGA
jgi:hypothetical protein